MNLRSWNKALSFAMGSLVLFASRDASACGSDAECKGDRICVDGVCMAPPETTSACSADTDCAGDTVCQSSACVAPDLAAPPPAVAAPPPAPAPPAPTTAPEKPAPSPHAMTVASPGATAPESYDAGGGSDGTGMLAGGLALLGGVYFLTILSTELASEGSPTGSATAHSAIPLFGPFVVMGEHESSLTEGGVAFYLLSGAAQIAGAALAITGGVQMGTSSDVAVQLAPGFDPKTGTASLTLSGPLAL